MVGILNTGRLALGRIVILGVMALGYINVSAILMVSLCHSSMAAKAGDACGTIVEG